MVDAAHHARKDSKHTTTPPKEAKKSGPPLPPAPASENGRTLVLCFDGTANEFDDTNTNVVKLVAMLEKESPKQLVYYQTGVGTYVGPGILGPVAKWVAKTADLGVAWYLDAHVMGGYKFLQSTWEPGDRICMFGFSRGAYTARALAGMLYTVGLLPREMPEQVDFAYSIFKNGRQSAAYKRAFSRTVTIEFIGVWDTVSSVGALYPRVLPFSADNHITKTFRHALALDEHRAKFRSNPWHLTIDPEEESPDDMPQAGLFRSLWHTVTGVRHRMTLAEEHALEEERLELDQEGGLIDRPPTDVKEVWFAGCHCDVGGGNKPDTTPNMLSNVPLRWMIKELIAADTGIVFRKSEMSRYRISYAKLVEQAAAEKRQSISISLGSDSIQTVKRSEAEVMLHHHEKGITAPTAVEGDQGTDAAPEKIDLPTTPASKKDKKQTKTYKDSISPITDELVKSPAWWLLEILPFIDNKQDEHNHWINYVRVNLGRPRNIAKPPDRSNPNSVHNDNQRGVNIPDVPALFHVSVKDRIEAPECNTATWRSLWRKKNKPYRPRAWPKTGDPVYVE